jgi:penicillin-binding protein 2
VQQVELNRIKVFNRRLILLGGLKLVLLSVVGGQLYNLQILQREKYLTKADENRINIRVLPPPRGRILDRSGRVLADNKQTYRLVLVAEQSRNVEKVLDVLSSLVTITEGERQRILTDVKHHRPFIPVTIRRHLAWSEVARIEIDAPYLPGVSVEAGELRHYLMGSSFAHVVGYVGAASKADILADPVLGIPGFHVGKDGIEKGYEASLRGRSGNVQVEVNAHGRVIRELQRDDGIPGNDIALTLDAELQDFAARRLASESASATLLNVRTGECLVMVSTPSFDPNIFVQGFSQRQWKDIVSNRRSPLSNKAVSGQYPPGSVFKLVVAAAALEYGVIDPNHRVDCKGHIQLGDRAFHCWRKGGHKNLDLLQAIAQSCDVYFYDLALKVGADRIAEMAQELGFGRSSGLDLPGEKTGLIPTPNWKRATYGDRWQKGDTLNTAIGQGYVLATPLQLAIMTSRLVNGGFLVTPRLVQAAGPFSERGSDKLEKYGKVKISTSTLSVIRQSMFEVVNKNRGTAYKARIKEVPYIMGGKTGTIQVRRISTAEREKGVIKNKDRPWEHRDHALFVGYAPVEDPKYAIAVVVEHGGSGASMAAPMAHDILLQAQLIFATHQRELSSTDGSQSCSIS